MARTQATDYSEKGGKITHVAARLFARHGFARTALSHIAEACAISKSAIYHYHQSKEDILFAVMDEHMTLLLDVAALPFQEDVAPQDRFGEFTRQLMQRYAGKADSQKVLLYELDNMHPDKRAHIVAKQRQLIAHIDMLLRQAIAPEQPDRTRLRVQIMLFFGMINWSHSWFKPDTRMSGDQLADMVTRTTITALT